MRFAGVRRGVLAVALAGAVLGTPVRALEFFGYIAVSCDHDDPFDSVAKTDYADEVRGFTNANHVCLSGHPEDWAATLARTAAEFDPVISVEGLFDFGPAGGGPDGVAAQALWGLFRTALADSGVPPERLFFYLADEPTLRGIPLEQIGRAGEIIHRTYPGSRTMLVEAYREGGPPAIPASVDFWGFDAYAVPDPGAEPLYRAQLDAARRMLRPDQRIVLILDAQYTPTHAGAGLTAEAMADVARATFAFAKSQPDVAGMLGYTWAGGIDNLRERGLRDLPQSVRDAHMAIGREILGLQGENP
jgi:hypothetical protein